MYPVLLEGTRLRLRELASSDTPAILAATANPSALRYLPLEPMDDDEVQAYVEELVDAASEPERFLYPLAMVRREDDQVVGLAQLGIESFLHRRGEIGYLVGADYWGKGYGSESVQLITEFGFEHLGLRRIFAIIAKGNDASRKLLENQGFQQEGTMRDQLLIGKRWVDGDLYAQVAETDSTKRS